MRPDHGEVAEWRLDTGDPSGASPDPFERLAGLPGAGGEGEGAAEELRFLGAEPSRRRALPRRRLGFLLAAALGAVLALSAHFRAPASAPYARDHSIPPSAAAGQPASRSPRLPSSGSSGHRRGPRGRRPSRAAVLRARSAAVPKTRAAPVVVAPSPFAGEGTRVPAGASSEFGFEQ